MISRHRMSVLLLLVCLFPRLPLHGQSMLDNLGIEVKGHSRGFAYTNKVSAFYYGETNSDNTTSWQGFNVFGHEFIDDYAIVVDGSSLDRRSVLKTIVFPDYLKRIYSHGITEELRIIDSLAVFVVVISSPSPIDVGVIPFFTDGGSTAAYQIIIANETALISRANHLFRTKEQNYPVWLAVHGQGFAPVLKEDRRGSAFSPVRLQSVGRRRVQTIAFAVADSARMAEAIAEDVTANPRIYAKHRRARMETLLRESAVETNDKRFDKALAWAKLSLDALIMNQVTKGIFAGLPWFNNYWGRDTFISLPGAALVTGRFNEAKQILRSFAAFQQADSTWTDYGRIPNLVTTTEKAYNTADGTPRFVMMARAYVERSGDSSFVSEVYPIILRSIEGTLKYHTDSLGFLTHGDAETWMDAVGPDGPWSPRGNRANDIQALWARQLDAGKWFAARVGDVVSEARWHNAEELVRANVPKYFILQGKVSDHLKQDGARDTKSRPNQIFVSHLVNDPTREAILGTVTNELTYEYGVASLSQTDEYFHPFHEYPPYYPKDAAYHNGTVWTWLQGELISELCRFGHQEVAAKLTANTVHQILDRGAVGTQSELLDAIPRPGEKEPRLSGTFSQAWSLAEFIRNFYDDYFGVQACLYERKVTLRPRLPSSMGKTWGTFQLGEEHVSVEIEPGKKGDMMILVQPTLKRPLKVQLELPIGRDVTVRGFFCMQSNSRYLVKIQKGDISLYLSGRKIGFDSVATSTQHFRRSPKALRFLQPNIRPELKALKGPGYPLLSHELVKETNSKAKLLVDVADAVGDDLGAGSYTYPRNPAFKAGSFDITHFNVRYDDVNAYFVLKLAALSNPGWHPEYGFQLTYVAIALDHGGAAGPGATQIPQNARYTLPGKNRYQRLILVGGGLQIHDAKGKILAAYVPVESDVSDPLGIADSGTIRFALPLSFLGKPSKSWSFIVLSGSQDDHGGAGIGEFRTVNQEPGEWNGGGKKNPDDPNVYDTLVAQQEQ